MQNLQPPPPPPPPPAPPPAPPPRRERALRIIALARRHARFVLDRSVVAVQASPLCPRGARPRILRWWGMDCASDVIIEWGCNFGAPHIRIGHGTFLNRDVQMGSSAEGPIDIGDHVAIGTGTLLITTDHEIGEPAKRVGAMRDRPITIADGCWLASRVVVLPGVTIGAGCVVAAGAVVTRDCDPNGLYAGVPARRIRDLPA